MYIVLEKLRGGGAPSGVGGESTQWKFKVMDADCCSHPVWEGGQGRGAGGGGAAGGLGPQAATRGFGSAG